ncbi:endonuclease/exonuclease/phosphatase family protein [Pimelobacter simplex]|uniref:endonuclease/exonuclease/phosphatase family protein n=1 Tax=Nocardioides simplex TaxID=2045 RepID=UPI0019334A52|nr:endonuclease/exonuclease/phosphatase family protein [Pimelobacter simplex]
MRIGTWNLENLFRPHESDAAPSSHADYDAKLTALATTIDALAPDVLAVQEVGDPDALDDLLARLDGTWTAQLASPDGRGIRVGCIARVALTAVAQVTSFPAGLHPVQVGDHGETMDAMGRPALHVRVGDGADAIDLVSAHLKSKLLTYPGGRFGPRDEGERARYAVYALHRRAAEAAAVRDAATHVLDDGPGRRLVVAGDLNDEPDAATTQILLGPGGSEIGTAGFDRPDRGDAARLWNLAPLIPEDQRFSRIYRGRRELIDHLLVSHALVGTVRAVTTGTPAVLPATPSITDDPGDRRDAPGSDHRPVVATLGA